jgi:hypothetical protein
MCKLFDVSSKGEEPGRCCCVSNNERKKEGIKKEKRR